MQALEKERKLPLTDWQQEVDQAKRFRLKSVKTRVIEVHLKAIKALAVGSRGAGLFEGRSPAPQCFEQRQPWAAQWISVNTCG